MIPIACSTRARTLDLVRFFLRSQQKLKQSLEQNGFKKVVVLPEAYVIHTQAPDGSKIVMEVSPEQMEAVIERTGSTYPPSNNTTR
jgi:hypothetical protein